MRGFEIYRQAVTSRRRGIERLTSHLAASLARWPQAQHFVIGHSQGGNIAFQAMRDGVSRLRADDRSSKALVQTIVSLARSFKMTVFAEGVETIEQLGLLWEMDCDQSQGYLHSKPVVVAEMAELLRTSRNGMILPPEATNASGSLIASARAGLDYKP